MNKNSIIFILIGIALIVGIVFLVRKRETPPQNNIQTNNNPTPQPPPPPEFIELVLDYKSNTTFEPKIIRVEEGQKVQIKTTADITDEVHLHGYDVSAGIKPGEQAVLEFTANKTGRFPVELEDIKKDIAIIEVYPK